ncbi:phosphopantothenoylcysteine decarboxylase [Frankliniella occidentalis]|uniref:Phosphopantothenoylcysteine decarboxylase n=2 Tax=Frankliniella occidentalis TaxID=133901 RepID=A0A9C6XW55_FRAOC|nr:phosphopantothenoylcysteine decarboxylase [Frankliniella occidentalis]
METKKKVNVLVCCTGSVATIKIKELVDKILKYGAAVRVVSSEHAQHFFSVEELRTCVEVFRDEDEWTMWSKRGDPVLHIELGKWADVLLIAPLDANTLAKISQGLCDNLLTCVVRAWDVKKPLLFCPAMNTRMWEHPVTAIQISSLRSWGYVEVPCISKTLICGDTGLGAMAEIDTIVNTLIGTIEDTGT